MGGVKFRVGRTGQIVELEGEEGVVNARSMRIPGVREKVSALNELGGGVRFPGVKTDTMTMRAPIQRNYVMPPRMELGGMVAVQPQAISQQMDLDYGKLGSVVTNMVLTAVKALPAPYVIAKDVEDVNTNRRRVEARASR